MQKYRYLLRLTLLLPLLVVLSSCAWLKQKGKQTLETTFGTASGVTKAVTLGIKDSVELGKLGIDRAKEQASKAAERAKKIEEGIEKLDAGQQLIRDGISGNP